MKIFAVSDLHLPGNMDKTMDMFGIRWQGHFEKIKEDWLNKVSDEDVVLIAGDISWAMHLEQALPDLNAIGTLPGKKILIRGNHDFWWSSVSRVREKLPSAVPNAGRNSSRKHKKGGHSDLLFLICQTVCPDRPACPDRSLP